MGLNARIRARLASKAEAALACAPLFGGDTVFHLLPIGGRFRFPHATATAVKVSATRYRDGAGRAWQTGRNTAVIAEESRR
jgi:hypothetical protein